LPIFFFFLLAKIVMPERKDEKCHMDEGAPVMAPQGWFAWTGPAELRASGAVRVFALACTVAVTIALVRGSLALLPALTGAERDALLRVPVYNHEIRAMDHALQRAVAEAPLAIVTAFLVTYIALQTYAIPGSAFLSILAGSLFGRVRGVLLVTIAVVTGASGCYLLSSWLVRSLVRGIFPKRTARLARSVRRNRRDMFSYMLALRLTPLVPNWFINIASPVVGVRFVIFVAATLVGVLPATIAQVTTGSELRTLASDDAGPGSSLRMMGLLLLLALGSLVPVWIRKRVYGDVDLGASDSEGEGEGEGEGAGEGEGKDGGKRREDGGRDNLRDRSSKSGNSTGKDD
jgi:uncharacterized membrane protein YdjX (TVP38/TMEM64 family)